MANTPEKWARNFMNDAEAGNVIPIRHTNNSELSTLNIALPNLPAVGSFMPRLGPMGTRSGLGMLPNLKKPLINTRSRFNAASPEWVPSAPILPTRQRSLLAGPPPLPTGPPPLPAGPPPLPAGPLPPLQPEQLINYMLQGRRLYLSNFLPEQRDKLSDIMKQYRDTYDIHYWFKDPKTGSPVQYPFYYIGHRTGRKSKRTRKQRATRKRRV